MKNKICFDLLLSKSDSHACIGNSSAPRKELNPWVYAHTYVYQNVLRFFLTTNWIFNLVLYYSCLNFKFVIFVFITWEYWLSIWSLLCFSSCHRQLMKTHLKLEKSVDVLTYNVQVPINTSFFYSWLFSFLGPSFWCLSWWLSCSEVCRNDLQKS